MIGPALREGPFPRNIYDDQVFDEDCTTLPPVLPDSEPTQVSYLIAKSKLVFGFARALDEISRPDTMKWERVLEIDRELRHIYNNVPEYYKLARLSSQDSLVLVSARFVLSSIHHKSLCVLHSRFLDIANTDDRFLYSRRVCLSSAMSILRFQAVQNQNIPVDGRLRSLTNYQTSLVIHDYLLAATILAADLCSARAVDNTTGQQNAQGMPTRMEMLKSLGLSARIFSQMRDRSVEAYKAADVLEMLVRKLDTESQNCVRNSSDMQRVPNSHAFGSSATAMSSDSISAYRPTAPQEFSITSSSSGLNNGLDSSIIDVRNPQHQLSRTCSPIAHDSHTSGSVPEGSDLPESLGLDGHSSWYNHRVAGLCPPNAPVSHMFPGFESSANWLMPEVPTIDPWTNLPGARPDANEATQQSTLDVTFDSTIPAPAKPVSYSAAIALSDPLSTLWNFSL